MCSNCVATGQPFAQPVMLSHAAVAVQPAYECFAACKRPFTGCSAAVLLLPIVLDKETLTTLAPLPSVLLLMSAVSVDADARVRPLTSSITCDRNSTAVNH